jgi:hypothetical protein
MGPRAGLDKEVRGKILSIMPYADSKEIIRNAAKICLY